MALTARETGGKSFDPVPEALHSAVCYAVFDLGTHPQERWNKRVHKVLITWEIPELRIEIEKNDVTLDLPRALSKRYTLSLHEKANLRKDLETWRGRKFTPEELDGFDLKKLLGVSAQIQVIHADSNGKTYANISAVVPSKDKLTPENPVKYFSFEEDGDIPEGTPEWIVELIQGSDEWQMKTAAFGGDDDSPPIDSYDDDIPF